MADPAERPDALATTSDALLGGRLRLRQPLKGHRVGSDAVLLAAAAPAEAVARLVDVGAGVGAVGLAVAQRRGEANVDLVELNPDLAALAVENAAINGLTARARVACVDITLAPARRAAGLIDGAADLVLTNPPFFDARNVRVSPDRGRANAHVFSENASTTTTLEKWIVSSLALLRAGGHFVMIHRPDALAQILAAFGRRLGSIAILPVHPQASAPAHRLLLIGVKGARGPTTLRPGLVLHEETGAFTPLAEALHRGEALIDWGRVDRRGARP
jgi:tRNA1(Val) A37 N6-methylase TrmN6